MGKKNGPGCVGSRAPISPSSARYWISSLPMAKSACERSSFPSRSRSAARKLCSPSKTTPGEAEVGARLTVYSTLSVAIAESVVTAPAPPPFCEMPEVSVFPSGPAAGNAAAIAAGELPGLSGPPVH